MRRWIVASVAVAVSAAAWGEVFLADETAAVVAMRTAERRTGETPEQPRWLRRIYSSGSGAVWFTRDGARPAIGVALRELRAAAERGLRVADYDVDRLQRDIDAASREPTPRAVARADVVLTGVVLQLLSDVRFGRVRPQDVEPHYAAPPKDAPFVEALRDAVVNNRLTAVIDAAEPSFAVYGRLKALLARYRAFAGEPRVALPALAPRAKVAPGDRYEGAGALRAVLVREGDLAADAAVPIDGVYADALAAGVVRFQQRHGLAPDGVLGTLTLAALAVPASARIRQIELSLERLRWLPEWRAGPLIAINIPSFRLWALDDAGAQRAALSMPVIVGKAMRGETPAFIGEMRRVEFSPYWNAPASIARKELAPQLARDASMLARDDMEFVTPSGAVATTVDDATLAALRAGDVRIRQRPGPKNALGGVKFVLRNAMDVYLHGTPARALFERSRRDFSHGCIRVGDPAALARFVLRERTEWTPARIDAAMAAGRSRTVELPSPVPVVIFYTTAIVDAEGRALFLPDVYGHDERLERALAQGR